MASKNQAMTKNAEMIHSRLRVYVDLKRDGLEVFTGKKRFGWKEGSSKEEESSKFLQMAAKVFEQYYEELRGDPKNYSYGMTLYDGVITPHAREVDKGLNMLILQTDSLGFKRDMNRFVTLKRQFQAAEKRLKERATPVYQKRTEDAVGILMRVSGQLEPDGLRDRLIHRLFDLLDSETNLTIKNKDEHVARMLHHMRLIEDGELDGMFTVVHQTRYGRGKKHRDTGGDR